MLHLLACNAMCASMRMHTRASAHLQHKLTWAHMHGTFGAHTAHACLRACVCVRTHVVHAWRAYMHVWHLGLVGRAALWVRRVAVQALEAFAAHDRFCRPVSRYVHRHVCRHVYGHVSVQCLSDDWTMTVQ